MIDRQFEIQLDRRSLLILAAELATVGRTWKRVEASDRPAESFFQTRGVVLTPEDLSLTDWPERASLAGLTTISLHPFPNRLRKFVVSEAGQRFVNRCQRLGLQVEYELHALGELLPRDLYHKDRSLFRMDDTGKRNSDANLCVHSAAALEIVAGNAVACSRDLRPTTGRYFLWGDDARPWCRCPKCRELSDSEQSLVVENHLLNALRKSDPRAQLAHLAYHNTLAAPSKVKPSPGIFLEFAPIHRRYDQPYSSQGGPDQQDPLSALDENLAVFPVASAQVLEYWIDVSRFSKWKRPAVRLPWRKDVFEADLLAYAARGIRNITSFAVYVDREYQERYDDLEFIAQYGQGLRNFRPSQT